MLGYAVRMILNGGNVNYNDCGRSLKCFYLKGFLGTSLFSNSLLLEALDITFSLDCGITSDSLCWLRDGVGGTVSEAYRMTGLSAQQLTQLSPLMKGPILWHMRYVSGHMSTRFISFSTYLFTPKHLAY